METGILLYPGIELYYLEPSVASLFMQHKALPHRVQLLYCKAGQLIWDMKNGSRIYLNPGDFSLHSTKACTEAVLRFPANSYQGLALCIDLPAAAAAPPELLKDCLSFDTCLLQKCVQSSSPVFLARNRQSEEIFSGFYNQPSSLQPAYQRLKLLELLLYLEKTGLTSQGQLTEYQSDLIEAVRKIHDQLLLHLEQRITIEELSRQYLINPTTLKNAFKTVYGTSLAAHIKEHRMEQAAKMLKETDKNIAEIARAIGYDSQSKFTAAFKAYFQVLPKEYRKR